MRKPSYSRHIFWSNDGTQILVRNRAKFENVVLRKEFNHRNFSSFQRQLNMYQFTSADSGSPRVLAYAHKSFTRDRPGHIVNVIRSTNRQIKSRSRISMVGHSPA